MEATSVAANAVRLNLVRFLHWRLMYQFLNTLPQLTPEHTYAHMHTHIHKHAHTYTPVQRYTGCSVLREMWHSRGTRRVPSWKTVAIVTIIERISRGLASFTQLHSLPTENTLVYTHTHIHTLKHTSAQIHPPHTYLQLYTHTKFLLFLPFMVKPAASQCLTLTECDRKQADRAIRTETRNLIWRGSGRERALLQKHTAVGILHVQSFDLDSN